MGWMLRPFQSRERSLMLTLLKSLVIPLIEYCCQLWNPWKAKDIQAIEAIQWTFTYKITEAQHLIYWERLRQLKIYSFQRCRLWKITQHMVTNIEGTMAHKIKTRKYQRHGTHCVIQYPTNRNPKQSIQENAITLFGPGLYNSLPKYLRDIENFKNEKLKFELHKFVSPFLMSPKCPTMSPQQEATASSTSSLIWGL